MLILNYLKAIIILDRVKIFYCFFLPMVFKTLRNVFGNKYFLKIYGKKYDSSDYDTNLFFSFFYPEIQNIKTFVWNCHPPYRSSRKKKEITKFAKKIRILKEIDFLVGKKSIKIHSSFFFFLETYVLEFFFFFQKIAKSMFNGWLSVDGFWACITEPNLFIDLFFFWFNKNIEVVTLQERHLSLVQCINQKTIFGPKKKLQQFVLKKIFDFIFHKKNLFLTYYSFSLFSLKSLDQTTFSNPISIFYTNFILSGTAINCLKTTIFKYTLVRLTRLFLKFEFKLKKKKKLINFTETKKKKIQVFFSHLIQKVATLLLDCVKKNFSSPIWLFKSIFSFSIFVFKENLYKKNNQLGKIFDFLKNIIFKKKRVRLLKLYFKKSMKKFRIQSHKTIKNFSNINVVSNAITINLQRVRKKPDTSSLKMNNFLPLVKKIHLQFILFLRFTIKMGFLKNFLISSWNIQITRRFFLFPKHFSSETILTQQILSFILFAEQYFFIITQHIGAFQSYDNYQKIWKLDLFFKKKSNYADICFEKRLFTSKNINKLFLKILAIGNLLCLFIKKFYKSLQATETSILFEKGAFLMFDSKFNSQKKKNFFQKINIFKKIFKNMMKELVKQFKIQCSKKEVVTLLRLFFGFDFYLKSIT